MVDGGKQPPPGSIASDLRSIVSILRRRRTKVFAYGFMIAFVACTAYIAFFPPGGATTASPWFNNVFAAASASAAPYRSQLSSFFSSFFPDSASVDSSSKDALVSNPTASPSSPPSKGGGEAQQQDGVLGKNHTAAAVGSPQKAASEKNQTSSQVRSSQSEAVAKNLTSPGSPPKSTDLVKGKTDSGISSRSNGGTGKDKTSTAVASPPPNGTAKNNQTGHSDAGTGVQSGKQTAPVMASLRKGVPSPSGQVQGGLGQDKNQYLGKAPAKDGAKTPPKATSPITSTKKASPPPPPPPLSPPPPPPPSQKTLPPPPAPSLSGQKSSSGAKPASGTGKSNDPKTSANARAWSVEEMKKCDIFHGKWVKDDSYPLYREGSCPHIDEPFDCYMNGRPDRAYQKLRWQPDGCNIPRLNATDMLERLRGKRLVFVGDSLNRNMWESLVCILKNSVKDKKKVFEASGRHEFRTEGSYSFLFKDYGCTVEFFRSPFLVQEWETAADHGKKKETLRLDIIERSSSKYKSADIIVFNTGHWWTHEKTAKGKDYYQEGNRVYGELNVVEAFHKALNTWAKWVDTNVDPRKTSVFFRGYSASHFSGGQWNSGGACDSETEPIKNEKYLSMYPPKMRVLESVLKGMKTPVAYLNITRMTDYRKDAHPSIYRKPNLTEEERRSPDRYQDCSHWCLPGVPDSWNELLFAQLIVNQHQHK